LAKTRPKRSRRIGKLAEREPFPATAANSVPRRFPEHRCDIELDDDAQDVPSIGRIDPVRLKT